jgi:signal transduction histidine kinase
MTTIGWIVLIAIAGACLAYLVYILLAIHDLQRRVKTIAASRTNNDVRTTSRNPLIIKLANAINTLLADQRQERADNVAVAKQIDQAINNISHDLRTPLTVASGYVQYLSEKQLPPAKAQQVLTQAEENLEIVNTRLESLLEYNRITEHRLTVQAEDFDLSALVQNALLALYDALQTAGFTVTPQIASSVLVHLDQEKTQRIIQNLLGNALTHGIKTLTVSLAQQSTAHTVTLTVTNGIAHPISHLERLTDRFYTEDLAGQTGNSGLGLYIAQHLAELMQGKLTLTTTAAIFTATVTLPQQVASTTKTF